VSLPVKNRFDPSFGLTEKGDKPSQLFRDYMTKLDALVTAIATGANVALVDAVNDAAAHAAGVEIGQLYRNGSIIMVRIA
jgi:hypothetical protein